MRLIIPLAQPAATTTCSIKPFPEKGLSTIKVLTVVTDSITRKLVKHF